MAAMLGLRLGFVALLASAADARLPYHLNELTSDSSLDFDFAVPTPPIWPPIARINRRQNDPDSVCSVYGVDIQGGGSYFINSNSNDNFTAVSEFEGCNAGVASVLLVNDQTSAEYECTALPTTPDDTPRMSSCPILKSQMSSGSWTILTIGNNGDGQPFSYQRDFTLQVSPQQTTTVTVSVPLTLSVQSTITVESTSTLFTTSGINGSTTTVASMSTATYTPPLATATTTEVFTHTFYRWAKTAMTNYLVVVQPSCAVPARPATSDSCARITPTIMPLPAGIQRQQTMGGRSLETPAVQRRDVDAPTVTITVTVPNNTTLTATANATTITKVKSTTNVLYTSLPPQTVYVTASVTVSVPGCTSFVTASAYTQAYLTKTMYVVWTATTTTTPDAVSTQCKQRGGRLV
ncbi:hypothetical protein LTR53_002963 [Teratosphaeriaceae sp. CCFEE 6253]|nr:hypothetical protein LTR53_002963 [Teratosphaeriaceae sp. CCFEE 6253]